MISNNNPIKKNRNDEENAELVESDNDGFQISNPGSFIKCMQNNSYCLSLMDYLKKLVYFSQIDFHSAYVQLIYCFNPQEINEIARIRKRNFKIFIFTLFN